MKQNEIPDNSISQLKASNIAKIFNVYQSDQGKYFYNLLNSVTVPENIDRSLYTSIFPLPGEFLPQLSYRVYKTIDLAWLIAETNKIDDMLQPLDPAVPVRILNDDVVRDILLRLTIGE